MSAERQLPFLFLRGSLSSVTLKNITPEEKAKVELVFHDLVNEPELKKTKIKFSKTFNRTIRADYEEEEATEQDYLIALWRACADLLVHRKVIGYVFDNCSATSYVNDLGMTIKHNQCYQISPCCGVVKLNGQFVNPESLTPEQFDQSDSPITAIRGDRKYTDEILNDRASLIKFVSKHIANYQQQVIKENQPLSQQVQKTFNVTPGIAAIYKIAQLLISASIKFDVAHANSEGKLINSGIESEFHKNWWNSAEKMNDSFGIKSNEYHLLFDTFACDCEMVVKIMLILQEYSRCGIIHQLQDDKLVIYCNKNDLVSIAVQIKEKVRFKNGQGSGESGSETDGLDNISHGGIAMIAGFGDDHENNVEVKEIINKITSSLTEISRKIWVLQVQSTGYILDNEPDNFTSYNSRFPGNKINNTDLASYLGVSPRMVKKCKEEIKTQCSFYGLD